MGIPLRVNILAAEYAKRNEIPIALDCGGDPSKTTMELISLVDFISPNETEV